MKQTLPVVFALALTGALSLSAFNAPSVLAKQESEPATQESGDGSVESRLRALETELKDLKMANKKQEALLTQCIKYLENQAASGAKLSAAMGKSESLGFTKGINFQSREVMLAALFDHCKALQKDVPRVPKPAPKPVARRR